MREIDGGQLFVDVIDGLAFSGGSYKMGRSHEFVIKDGHGPGYHRQEGGNFSCHDEAVP